MPKLPSASPSVPAATEPDTQPDWYARCQTLMGAVEHHRWAVLNDNVEDADEELWDIFSELELELWAEGE